MTFFQDYPSYGLLSKALDENKINTFFVVSEKYEHLYKGLSGIIKQAETAIMKDGESQSIVDKIKEYYSVGYKKSVERRLNKWWMQEFHLWTVSLFKST